MALLMPTSANYFYEYLETRGEMGNTLGENGKEALAFFGLYADIRTYLRLFEEGGNEELKRAQAQQILEDYIIEGHQWDVYIPGDVHAELSLLLT